MDSSISAYSAYSLMAANEQQSVPVWDSRSDRYCGTLTTTDLVQLILLCAESKEHESCVQGMRDMDLDHFISNYSRPPWGEQVPSKPPFLSSCAACLRCVFPYSRVRYVFPYSRVPILSRFSRVHSVCPTPHSSPMLCVYPRKFSSIRCANDVSRLLFQSSCRSDMCWCMVGVCALGVCALLCLVFSML